MIAPFPLRAVRPRRLWFAVVALAVVLCGFLTILSDGAQSSGSIVTGGGEHKIVVEVADTPGEREVGLMNRSSMPKDHGMLFDFRQTRPVSMWMKNTYIPLDMLFMDASGVVTHLAANAQPLSLDVISSEGAVRYVLELNGGAIARLGIKVGDRLKHPAVSAAGG